MPENYKPKKYIKQPVEVDAIKWTGKNYVDICLFMGREALTSNNCEEIIIYNLDGPHKVSIGDFIVRDENYNYCMYSAESFNRLYKEAGNG